MTHGSVGQVIVDRRFERRQIDGGELVDIGDLGAAIDADLVDDFFQFGQNEFALPALGRQ